MLSCLGTIIRMFLVMAVIFFRVCIYFVYMLAQVHFQRQTTAFSVATSARVHVLCHRQHACRDGLPHVIAHRSSCLNIWADTLVPSEGDRIGWFKCMSLRRCFCSPVFFFGLLAFVLPSCESWFCAGDVELMFPRARCMLCFHDAVVADVACRPVASIRRWRWL